MPTETQLRKPFVEALRRAGGLVIPYVGSTYGQMGTADVFLAHINWSGWIEFKGPKTKIEPIQQKFIEDMRKRRVNAVVLRLLEDHEFKIEPHVFKWEWDDGFDILARLQANDCLQW